MFPSLPSDDYFDVPPAPGLADGQTLVCPCGQAFVPAFPEQLRCNRCRSVQLRMEQTATPAINRLLLEYHALEDQWEHEHDWQLQDPDRPGHLVWAKDLAKRYRAQTRPRPVRNQLSRWS